MRAIAIALVVGACYSPTPPAGAPCGEGNACPSGQACIAGFCGGGGSAADSRLDIDAPEDIDATPTCMTWNAKHFDACAIPAPTGDLNLTTTLSGFAFDTSAGTLKGKMNTSVAVTTMVVTQPNGPDAMLISVNDFTLEANATLDINGTRPLIIAVWGTATINGDIDASAVTLTAGPGGYAAVTDPYCAAAAVANSGTAGTPATGGGGGAMQGNGGTGGNTGGGPGVAIAVPSIVRGGCAGGLGGLGTTTQAPRGAGGGAVQITARLAINVNGTITAGGGAGAGGRSTYGGGGGGGAGGYIGFDAPMVNIVGTVAANGGSGGGGASDVVGGNTGPNGLTSDVAALGGLGATMSMVGACPRGGNGSGGGSLSGGVGGTSGCGGGGGGGGAGYVLIWSTGTSVTGTVSPPAVAGP